MGETMHIGEKSDEQRERVFFGLFKKLVLRVGDENGPIYLIRYSIFSCPWFAVKLHRILISDDDCLHDHPWSFLSIILWGGYIEETVDLKKMLAKQQNNPWSRLRNGATSTEGIDYEKSGDVIRSGPRKKTRYGLWSILWRPNPWPHRLIIEKPATTLVITFKRARTWGFYTANGWVEWMKYIRMGRPCE